MSRYRTHVGQELEMMLSGVKPLATFYGDADSERDERIIPERRFSPYVQKGQFCEARVYTRMRCRPEDQQAD